MRKIITVSIPEDMKKQIDKIAEEEGTTRSNIIKESLQNYLFIREFRTLRARMMKESSRVYTDKDIFEQVS
ncbi:MAG TPA: ribbon-helix-helix domain-containing protein [Candidatus Ratteibacteria bacterium]|nr:ribbon-helix-helix domain-containing protein [Candidatus Ratteibacteria bacterium]